MFGRLGGLSGGGLGGLAPLSECDLEGATSRLGKEVEALAQLWFQMWRGTSAPGKHGRYEREGGRIEAASPRVSRLKAPLGVVCAETPPEQYVRLSRGRSIPMLRGSR